MGREEESSGKSGAGGRSVVYCVIPPELASKLHDLLREHFRDEPDIEVVVERRGRERRRGAERRAAEGDPPGSEERRRIRSPGGRRVGDRRAAQAPVSPPALPRRARGFAKRIAFVERTVPAEERLEDLDTARLVTRIQAGESELLGDLYLRYFDRLYGYLRVALNDRHGAEDAAQQVFAQVLEALPAYERRRQPFRAWLFAIARNHVIQLLRRESRVDVVDPARLGEQIEHLDRERGEESMEPELPALGWISDGDLLVFVERMPKAQRQVLTLRYVMGLTMPEIAKALDKSPDAVRRAHSRALVFLRERLTAVGREPKDRRGGRTEALTYRSQARVVRARRFQLTSSGPVR